MKPEVQILIDYVEGNLDIKRFKYVFETDCHMQDLLKKKIDPDYVAYKKYDYNIKVANSITNKLEALKKDLQSLEEKK